MHWCRGWNKAASRRYIYVSHFAHCFAFTSRMYICEISAEARPPTGGARWGKRRKRAKAFRRSQHLISGHVWCFLWSAQLSVCFVRSRCLPVVPWTKMQRSRAALRCDQLAISVAFFESHPFFFPSPHAISSAFNLLQRVMPPFTSVYYVLIIHGHFLLPC